MSLPDPWSCVNAEPISPGDETRHCSPCGPTSVRRWVSAVDCAPPRRPG